MKEMGETLILEQRAERKRASYPVKKESLKSLAEAIILQSMEDSLGTSHKEQSIEFFKGEGFGICAKLAGLGAEDQAKIIGMLAGPLAGK